MKKPMAIIVVLALVMAVIFRLMNNHEAINSKKNKQETVSIPVAVNVANVKKMAADRSLKLVGTLNAWKELTIAAEAPGKIESLNVEAGQVKSKGEVLAVIDNRLKQLSVENASVGISKLKKDLERTENLFNGGSASQQQLDDARNSYENARIQLDQAKKQLADATVTSPISGIIIQKHAEQGAYLNIGSPIAAIVDISRLKVKLNVSETNVYRLKVRDKAAITTDVYPGVSFEGHVAFISAQGDDTHNYPVEIAMNNSSRYPMKAGTFVTVHIDAPDKHIGLFILRQALQGGIKDAGVYVIDHDKAVRRNIVVGNEYGEYLEIVSGLSEGDRVVITGQVNLSDGKSVSIVNN
jgi:membrane fusion protein, multidrug efflux system